MFGAAVAAAIAAAASASLAAPPPPTAVPRVMHVHLTPGKFRAALTPTPGFGANVHYQLTENSVQTFVVKKQVGAQWVTMKGTFVKRGRAGNDVFPFPGILHGKKLHKGRYEMVVTPTITGIGTGKSKTAHFTVTG